MHNLKSSNIKDLYDRVWDEADYVVPPAENGAFFVTTNVVITPNQTWGHCPEVIFCCKKLIQLVFQTFFCNMVKFNFKKIKVKGDMSVRKFL